MIAAPIRAEKRVGEAEDDGRVLGLPAARSDRRERDQAPGHVLLVVDSGRQLERLDEQRLRQLGAALARSRPRRGCRARAPRLPRRSPREAAQGSAGTDPQRSRGHPATARRRRGCSARARSAAPHRAPRRRRCTRPGCLPQRSSSPRPSRIAPRLLSDLTTPASSPICAVQRERALGKRPRVRVVALKNGERGSRSQRLRDQRRIGSGRLLDRLRPAGAGPRSGSRGRTRTARARPRAEAGAPTRPLAEPVERAPQVVVGGLEPLEPRSLIGAAQLRLGALCQLDEVGSVQTMAFVACRRQLRARTRGRPRAVRIPMGSGGRRSPRQARRAHRRRRRSSPTAAAASSVNLLRKSASRPRRCCAAGSSRPKLQSIAARIVRCRSGASRAPAASASSRESRSRSSSDADRERNHGAASSIASGMPSSRSQTSAKRTDCASTSTPEAATLLASSSTRRGGVERMDVDDPLGREPKDAPARDEQGQPGRSRRRSVRAPPPPRRRARSCRAPRGARSRRARR